MQEHWAASKPLPCRDRTRSRARSWQGEWGLERKHLRALGHRGTMFRNTRNIRPNADRGFKTSRYFICCPGAPHTGHRTSGVWDPREHELVLGSPTSAAERCLLAGSHLVVSLMDCRQGRWQFASLPRDDGGNWPVLRPANTA